MRFGRARWLGKTFKNVGGFAHIFDCLPGPPGPARLQKRTHKFRQTAFRYPAQDARRLDYTGSYDASKNISGTVLSSSAWSQLAAKVALCGSTSATSSTWSQARLSLVPSSAWSQARFGPKLGLVPSSARSRLAAKVALRGSTSVTSYTLCHAMVLPGRKSVFRDSILAGMLPGSRRNCPSRWPNASGRADFGAFPVAVRPKSGPEGRLTARKHYCVT